MIEVPKHLLDVPGPSETTDWLFCPTYWYLNRTWEASGIWTPNLDVGSAGHKGLEVFFKEGLASKEKAISEALALMASLYQLNDDWGLDSLQSLIKKGLLKVFESTGADILAQEEVIATELHLGGTDPSGHESGKIDLVTRRGSTYIITDHKWRMKMEERWVQKELTEIETDWQLWDYAYRVRETFKTTDLAIRRHLIRLTPKTKADLQEYTIKPDVLEKWRQGAVNVWAGINHARVAGEMTYLPMNLGNCLAGRYGRCRMYEACHIANQEPKAIEILYSRKEQLNG